MLRWAIYARHSSDRQNPKSCEDQVRECEMRIAALGGVVVKRYADEGISGAHEAQRPQYLSMLTAMKMGSFDAVMAEDLDRFNRSLEASARIYSLAERDGVELWTIADGRVTQLHTGLKGLMGELFLKQLADKTRRGVLAVARDGRIPGGNCYGYAVSGKGLRSVRTDQAAVLLRIYGDYAGGVSPVGICSALNREGVSAPRGKEWRVSTLIGNPKRLNGILNNPIYAGRPVFNRQKFVKDPETGKRMARPNPREVWIFQNIPELRIVPENLWQAAQARRERAGTAHALHEYRRAKTLLSGLVRCEECGSAMVLCNGYFRCTAHDSAGTCENNKGVRAQSLEGWVVEALKSAMDNEEIIAEYSRTLHAAVERIEKAQAREAEGTDRKRTEITRKIGNLMSAIEDGTASETVIARIRELEAERAQLTTNPVRANVVKMIPDASARFRAQLSKLENLLTGTGSDNIKAREAVRRLISRITARRHGKRLWIEADASFGALLAFARGPETWSISGCGSQI